MKPLNLDPNHLPTETELFEWIRELAAFSAQLAEMREITAHLESLVTEDPWVAIARMTARPHAPSSIQRRVAKARDQFSRALLRDRQKIRQSGDWYMWLGLTWRVLSMGVWGLGRLHLAGWLHRFHIVGVFDHRRDCARLQAWCG